MDLRNLRTAVRSLAREGSISDALLTDLSAEEREAVVTLKDRVEKAGRLQAVTPPTDSTVWF